MKTKLRVPLFLFCLILSGFVRAQSVIIHHINVGQGDATFIETKDDAGQPATTVLIDGGLKRYGEPIIDYITQTLHVNRINYVIASHYDVDHVGGLAVILAESLKPIGARIHVDTVLDRGDVIAPHPASGQAYRTQARLFGAQRVTIDPGRQIDLFDDLARGSHTGKYNIVLQCLCVNGMVYNPVSNFNAVSGMADPDENDLSTGWLITYGRFKYLTCGDIGGKKGQQMSNADGKYGCNFVDLETNVMGAAGPVSAYKINHHGSRCSSNNHWISTSGAAVVIISSGRNGSYKHPRPEVITLLNEDANLQAFYLTAPVNYYGRMLTPKGILNTGNSTAIDLEVKKESNNIDITNKSIFTVQNTLYQID